MSDQKKFCCKEVEILSTWGLGPLGRITLNGNSEYIGYYLEYSGITYCPCCGTYLDQYPEPPKDAYNALYFCCGAMCPILIKPDEDDSEIFYQPFTRRYFFSTSRNYRREAPDYIAYKEWDFQFCIYCGQKQPEPLLDLWLEIIKTEFEVERQAPLEKMLPLVPEEYQTDWWWKKRGL